MKKIIGLVLSLCLAFGAFSGLMVSADTADVWDGTTATAFAGGDGTEGNPYQIANGAQLALMRDKVNDGTANTAYFKLTADITLNADIENPTNTWTPIGVGNAFKGVFDGNGKTISGLYVKYAGADGAGFFAMVNDATIKSFALLNSYVESTATTNDCWETGGLAAFLKAVTKEVVIDSVYVHATVKGFDKNVGGLIGMLSGSSSEKIVIKNCVFAGSVTSWEKYLGGIVGNGNGGEVEIKDCLNVGNITSTEKNNVAGIMGVNKGKEKWSVTNCINLGVIKVGTASGGLRQLVMGDGSDTSNVVENCYAKEGLLENDGTTKVSLYSGAPKNNETVQAKPAEFFVGDTSITWANWTEREGDVIIPTGVAAFAPALYASSYTVTWVNEDGTVLATEEYEGGEMPAYKGATPTKADDATYTYTFDTWSPVLAAVTTDVTYTATFYKTRKGLSVDDDDETTKAPETTAAPTDSAATTDANGDEEEKGGCGSVIGGSVLVLSMILGSAVVLGKKKED